MSNYKRSSKRRRCTGSYPAWVTSASAAEAQLGYSVIQRVAQSPWWKVPYMLYEARKSDSEIDVMAPFLATNSAGYYVYERDGHVLETADLTIVVYWVDAFRHVTDLTPSEMLEHLCQSQRFPLPESVEELADARAMAFVAVLMLWVSLYVQRIPT